ncbi:MAG: hypothetical protein ACYSUC_11805, partial [Planctomycetota bacterium]
MLVGKHPTAFLQQALNPIAGNFYIENRFITHRIPRENKGTGRLLDSRVKDAAVDSKLTVAMVCKFVPEAFFQGLPAGFKTPVKQQAF